MKRRAGKIFITLFVLAALFLCAAAVAYAYFSGGASADLGQLGLREEPTETGASAVTVTSLYDLKVWARDDRYRNKSEVSPASSRHILVLGADIILDGDLFIDRDVSIALNGHTLDLGAHTLTVAHNFAARMVLTAYGRYGDASGSAAGGIAGSGKLRYETPNAVVAFDAVLQSDVYDAESNPDGHVVASLDETLTVAEISRRVENLVADGDCFVGDLPLCTEIEPYPFRVVWTVPETASLTKGINGTAETVANVWLFPDGRVETPDIAGVASYGVSLTLGYAIVRSDGAPLSAETVAAGKSTASLTVSILSGDTSNEAADARAAEGVVFLRQYFEGYRDPGSELYRLELDLALVGSLRYFGLSFSYSAKDTDAPGAAATDSPYLTGVGADGTRTLKNPGTAADVTLSVDVTVSYRNGAQIVTKTVPGAVTFRFVAADGNNANTARRLMETIGALVFTKTGETLYLLAKDDYFRYNLESIDFALEGDEGNYAIGTAVDPENGKTCDTVTLSVAPSYEKKIDLVLTLRFRSGAPVVWTAKTRLYYVDPSMGGGSEGDDRFAYYHYLATDALFAMTNKGRTYLTFSVPTVLLDTVEVKYFLAGDYGAAGAERIVLTEAADGASATFSIDRARLLTENEPVRILFKYRKKTQAIAYGEGWENVVYYGTKLNGAVVEGTPKEYRFELSGLYRKGTEIGADLFPVLYAAYNVSDLDDEEILTRDELNNPNITRLEISAEPAIASFTGLRYLKYIETLIVRNPGFGKSAYSDLVAMSALRTLDVSNASLGDVVWGDLRALSRLTTLRVTDSTIAPDSDFNALTSLTELTIRNCGLKTLTGVFKLPNLVRLDVSNVSAANPNAIRRFDGLYPLASLSEVYCYGNAAADGFGSLGKYNVSAFVLLADKGVAVYCETEADGIALKRFTVTEEAREFARAVEAIAYRNIAVPEADGGISLSLPETLPIGGAGTVNAYALEYVLIPADGVSAVVPLGFSGGALRIPPETVTAAGLMGGTAFELAVRVSKKNGTAVSNEILRILEISVSGGAL